MPGFDAAAGEPHGEGVDVVVAAGRFADLAHRRAAELAAPDDERVVEQAALLQVVDQRGAGLVDVAALRRQMLLQVLGRAAVVVPVGVVELHEPHAALDQPAGEQAVAGEAGLLAVLDAVQVERRLALAAGVHQLRGAGLHPVRHLVGVDPRGDFRVAGLDEPLQVQLADGVDELPLLRRR